MKLINIFKFVTVSAFSVILGACSVAGVHAKRNGQSSTAQADANSPGAQTYGVNDQAGYNSSGQARYANSLKPHTNQTYYFAFDSSDLKPEAMQALRVQANYLVTHPDTKIRLEGNTDDRGTQEYNIGLGWRRDKSVEKILEQQGVSPNQIKMVSYGKLKPAVTLAQVNDNQEEAWELNRRVNLVYLN